MTEDEARVGRHTVQSTVYVDPLSFAVGDVNHVRGEVDIEISGAESDRPHTYELLEEIEDAVEETVEKYREQVEP